MSFEASAIILAWVAIVLLAFALAGLVRQVQQLRMGVTPRGSVGPIIGSRPAGSAPWGPSLGSRTVVLFLDSDCETCNEITPELPDLASKHRRLDFVAVYAGAPNGLTGEGITVLAGQPGLFDVFNIPVTPYGVLVDETGAVIAAEPLGSSARLRTLAESAEKVERA